MADMIGLTFVVLFASLGLSSSQFTTASCYFWGTWGSFSSQTACDVTCGTGGQVRERTRICLRPRVNPPPGCRYTEVERETTPCDTGVSCTGTVSTWSAWADEPCSQYCGNGEQAGTRTRTCSSVGQCSGDLTETRTQVCTGAGGTCETPCSGFRSFIYAMGATSHVCIRGTYQPIACPASRAQLLNTCNNDFIRCYFFFRIERQCAQLGLTS